MFKSFRLSSLTAALGTALAASTAARSLFASPEDWRTVVTFSGPVDIGGTALSAGTYIFRTLDDNRNVVEIMNSDETHLVALVQAVSAQAAEPSGSTRIELQEGPSGSPEIVHKWFYPGDTIGLEFPTSANRVIRPSD